MKRRDFIKLTGAGATSATLLSACGHPENRLIPVFIPDDEYIPGIDNYKASACSMCRAGCGIVVRTREHKANKIEGNPLHPVNRGALCARGQAGLQVLYNPDRVRSPLKRAGERGRGQFEEISWDEAIKTLAERLREIKARGEIGSVAFVIGNAPAVSRLAIEHFLSAYGAGSLYDANASYELSGSSYLTADNQTTPLYDLSNATYLLSFGARFLEAWHSPVMYSMAYGEFRNSSGKARGRFVQIEPRMSLTAANADEWIPAAPASEELLALAISQVIMREGLSRDATVTKTNLSLDDYTPEKTASRIDIPAEKIIRIAREFARSERPLAICDPGISMTRAVETFEAVNFLNKLAGNANKPGGVFLPEQFSNPLEKLRPASLISTKSISDAAFGKEASGALLLYNANPAYTYPQLADQINSAAFIASFSSFMDETAQLADLILPDHSYLESWDIQMAQATAGEAVITLTQPAVKPELNTRQTADVLIALTREIGDANARPLPFDSAEQIVKLVSADLYKQGGSIAASDEKDFWKSFVERGVWTGKPALKEKTAEVNHQAASAPIYQQAASDNTSEYPFTLIVYEHAMLGLGEQANLPLLQELPDPMTTVVWGSWIEINPRTAARLDIKEGDLVEVTTPSGSAHAPALIYPAIRPDVVAIPTGQGHTAFGRYATGRGVNPILLARAGAASESTSETLRAKISKVAGKAHLVRFGKDVADEASKRR